MSAPAAVRMFAAEMRLAEVEALIEKHREFDEWQKRTGYEWHETKPVPEGDLAALYIERARLQRESFEAFQEAWKERSA